MLAVKPRIIAECAVLFLFLTAHIFGATISADSVNVRSTDSTEGKNIDKVAKGDRVIVFEVGKKESIGKWGEHYWYKVTYSPSFDEFFDGWIFGAFIDVKVENDKTELKTEASKKSKTKASLKKGTKVVISKVKIDKSSSMQFPDWYYVTTKEGKEGWVYEDDLD